MRLQIVSEHLIESVSLRDLSAKYLIGRSVISKWCKIAREQGYEYLNVFKTRGRPPKDDMGRPKKKKPEEMTELELLQKWPYVLMARKKGVYLAAVLHNYFAARKCGLFLAKNAKRTLGFFGTGAKLCV